MVVGLLALASGCRDRHGEQDSRDAQDSRAAQGSRAGGDVGANDAAPDATAPDAAAVTAHDPTRASGGEGTTATPYGEPHEVERVLCSGVAARVHDRDLRTSFVDGHDLLALLNRSPVGQLAPGWAPSDLVEIATGKPKTAAECDKLHCLRKEAAGALAELLAEMKKRGFPGKVESAFRGYGTQCGTFLRWASKSNFCDATEQSALPGHSQHQLGTTIDLFTEEWARDPRGAFREGFGCTPAARFLREHGHEFGFVMPYPLHPDDKHPRQSCTARWDIPVFINPRTGYRYEHWHFRYVGKEAAARFAALATTAAAGTPAEPTVEQWLRSERGLGGADVDLPVCDGCNCGACATLAPLAEGPCARKGGALHLDARGRVIFGEEAPTITSAREIPSKKWRGRLVEVTLHVPAGTVTQTPIVGPDGAGYAEGASFEALAPYPDTSPRAFPPLDGAWVVGVEAEHDPSAERDASAIPPADAGPGRRAAYPWRAGIAPTAVGQIYDRANVLLPARSGEVTLKIPVPAGDAPLRVVLLQGGMPRGEPTGTKGVTPR